MGCGASKKNDKNNKPKAAGDGGAAGGNGGGANNTGGGGAGDDDDAAERAKIANRPKRRGGVSSESSNNVNDDVELKVVPKSDEDKKRIREFVSKNFLFRGLEEEQIVQIVEAIFEDNRKAGDEVITLGDEGDNFYILDTGKCEIYLTKDKASVAAEVGPGAGFGELALMYNCPRAATIVCKTDCRLWAVDRQTFRFILMSTQNKKKKTWEGFLRDVPILKSLTESESSKLADALWEEDYVDGQYIIKQNDEGNKFFIVAEGACTVTSKAEGKDEQELSKLKVGDYFGEIALLTNQPRAASVMATGAAKCLFVDSKAFNQLLGPVTDILRRNMDNYKTYEELAGDGEAKAAVKEEEWHTVAVKLPAETDVDAVFKAMDKLYPLDKIEIEVNREEKEHRIVYEAAELPADAPAESFVAEMSVEKGADAVVFTWSVKAHGRGDADGDEANQWVASKYGDWDAAVKKAVA